MKDSFIVFTSYMKNISRLNMEQRGVLLTAMMCYQLGEDLPEMDAITDLAFSFIKDDMDFNNTKYEEKCEKNRINGKKGGRPSTKANGLSEKPKKANGLSENPTKPNKTLYEYDYEYEYEHDNKKNTPSQKKFVKPSVEDIKAYCQERNNMVNPEAFIDFYESKGWKVGNQPMKDWKAAVRNWERRDSKPNSKVHNFNERKYDYAALEKEFINHV